MKIIKLWNICLIILLGLTIKLFAGNIGGVNQVYGIYSETFTGTHSESNNPPDTDGVHLGAYAADGTNYPQITSETDFPVPVEGKYYTKVFKTPLCTNTVNSIYIMFGSTSTGQQQTDMSAYTHGKVSFWLINDTTVQFQIQWGPTPGAKYAFKNISTMHSAWTFCSYNLDSISTIGGAMDYKHITVPFDMQFNQNNSTGTFCYDNVVWSSATVDNIDLSLKNISDNVSITTISWSNLDSVFNSSNPWKAADQYIECNLSYASSTVWGIQIYTDNANATPAYTGASDPAGLIDTSSTSIALPMCWSIVNSTATGSVSTRLQINQHSDDNKLYDGYNYQDYLWMKDLYSPNIPTGFSSWSGNTYLTVWDNQGIQYQEGIFGPPDPTGSSPNPNYIYLGAKFTNAYAGRTYKTNKLTVELFYE